MKTKLIVLAAVCLMMIAVLAACSPGKTASELGKDVSEGMSKAGEGVSSTVSRLESDASNTGSRIESALDGDDKKDDKDNDTSNHVSTLDDDPAVSGPAR